jgi:hypothetical protein
MKYFSGSLWIATRVASKILEHNLGKAASVMSCFKNEMLRTDGPRQRRICLELFQF